VIKFPNNAPSFDRECYVQHRIAVPVYGWMSHRRAPKMDCHAFVRDDASGGFWEVAHDMQNPDPAWRDHLLWEALTKLQVPHGKQGIAVSATFLGSQWVRIDAVMARLEHWNGSDDVQFYATGPLTAHWDNAVHRTKFEQWSYEPNSRVPWVAEQMPTKIRSTCPAVVLAVYKSA
jgi:hypothetical protein